MSVLKFHGKLYSLAALEETAKLYGGVAGVKIRGGALYHEVSLQKKGSDFDGTLEELEKDFSNHALALMCSGGAAR